MTEIPFNVNCNVKVRLTDLGRNVHRQRHTDLCGGRDDIPYSLREDEDGWSTWQMWSLMEAFGSHMGMTAPLVFETNIVLLSEHE